MGGDVGGGVSGGVGEGVDAGGGQVLGVLGRCAVGGQVVGRWIGDERTYGL